MKILLMNVWPERPSIRPYLDHSVHDIWHACDRNGAEYYRTYLGSDDVKGLTLVERDDVGEFIGLMKAVRAKFDFERVVAFDEFTVLPAAAVRDYFDIPGPRVEEIEPFRNKRKMKEYVAKCGIRVIRDLDPSALSDGAFMPCVVKRVDGAAARGVHICRSRQELDECRADLEAGALLEEYVEGDFYHIDGAFGPAGFVAVPHAYINNCFDHFQNNKPLGSVGIDDPVLKRRLVDFAKSVIDAMPLREGIFHLEVIRTPRDELVFLEIGCRIGGGEIHTNFVDVYNFDLLGFCIDSQLGIHRPVGPLRNQDVAGWLMLNGFDHVPGVFTALRCGQLSADNCLYAIKHSKLGRLLDDPTRNFVTFAFRGKNGADVRASIEEVVEKVALESEPVSVPDAGSEVSDMRERSVATEP